MKQSLVFTLVLTLVCHFKSYFCSVNPKYAKYTVCQEPKSQHGLITPILPKNLVVFFEHTSSIPGFESTSRLYIDADNGKTAAIVNVANTHYHAIYDYLTNAEILITRSGDTYDLEAPDYQYKCNVMDIGHVSQSNPLKYEIESLLKNFLGYTRRMSFNESTIVRGINVDHYTGCLDYNNGGLYASYNTDYYFMDKSVSASGYERAPVSISAKGKLVNIINNNITEFSFVKSFYYFDVMRPKYQKVFQIPEGVYCAGYKKIKPLPPLEKSFVTSVEVVDTQNIDVLGIFGSFQNVFSQTEYRSEIYGMERLDFIPTGDNSILNGTYDLQHIKVVHDFKTDVSFVIQKDIGKCTFYNYNVLKAKGYKKFSFADNVIFKFNSFDTNYAYKGVEPCGNEKCDVWSSIKQQNFNENYENISTWTEIRFLADEWRVTYKNGIGKNVPVEVVTFFDRSSLGVSQVDNVRLRLHNFLTRDPTLEDFDISPCLTGQDRIYGYFEFEVPKFNLIETEEKKIQIENQVRGTISEVGEVPILRVQDVHVYFDYRLGKTVVTFSIMGQFVTDDKFFPNGPTSDALLLLNDQIDLGQFTIKISLSTGMLELSAIKYSLKPLFPTSNKNVIYENMFEKLQEAQGDLKKETNLYDDTEMQAQGTGKIGDSSANHKKDDKKYGAGPLAAVIVVMLLVGAVLGSLGMVVFFKRHHGYSRDHDEEITTFAMSDMK